MNALPLALLALLQVQASPVTEPRPAEFDSSAAPIPASAPGFFRTNTYLGILVLGSFAAIHVDGVNEIDEAFASQPVGHGRLSRTLPRTVGRAEVAASLAGGLILAGELGGDPALRRAGWRSLEALGVSSIGTTALKIAIGRSRPGNGREEDEFRPFRGSSDSWSFPSGHTSSAFALATAVSLELGPEHGWVPFVAYPLAAWAGASRVVDARHWPTDVLAGAAVGILSARLSRGWFGSEDDERPPRLAPVALMDGDGTVFCGVRVALR